MSDENQAQWSAAARTVINKMEQFKTLSESYSQQLSNSLSSIANVKVEDVEALKTLNAPTFLQIPTIKEFRPSSVTMPTTGDIDAYFRGISDIPNPPTLKSVTLQPLNFPQTPEKHNADFNVDIPDAPKIQMPELGSLEKIVLPKFKHEAMPFFDGKPPRADSICIPNVFINWREPEYKSELFDAIREKVIASLKGQDTKTGLPKEIEDAIFSRAKDRLGREVRGAVQDVIDTWAMRGFSLPQGAQVKQIEAVRDGYKAGIAESNRDLAIHATEKQLENLRFMVQNGIAMEQMLENLHSNTVNRLFEVAKFQAEAQINAFNSKIALFNAKLSAYQAQLDKYKADLEGSIQKLNAWKIQLDGLAVVGQLNQQQVQIYTARVEAVKSGVEVYKALLSGVQAKVDLSKSKIEAYKADIQAYSEQIAAEKSKVDIYEAQLRGEASKANVYEAQVKGYAAKISAGSSAAQAKLAKYAADIDTVKLKMQSEIDAYKAQMGAFTAEFEAKSRIADAETRTNIAYAQMQSAQYQAKMTNAVQKAQIALESAKSVGQYTAQLAAGAMSAQHISASISSSDSNSKSTSTSHNYSY